MRNLEVGDVVTAPGLRFQVSYYNKTDESYDIRLISQSGEFVSGDGEIEFVKTSKLERIQYKVSVGDVYEATGAKLTRDDVPDTLVVVAVSGDRIKVYSATDNDTYNTTVDDITNPKFYKLVKGEQ